MRRVVDGNNHRAVGDGLQHGDIARILRAAQPCTHGLAVVPGKEDLVREARRVHVAGKVHGSHACLFRKRAEIIGHGLRACELHDPACGQQL